MTEENSCSCPPYNGPSEDSCKPKWRDPHKEEISRLCEILNSFGVTEQDSERITNIMKASKPSKGIGANYAWAFYIRTGANKEGSFDEYMRYNKNIKPWSWEMLNRTFKC